MTIKAELIGIDRCTALGIEARHNAPVLALCRKLVDAGINPATPLEAWRGNVLCLKIRSIGEGAMLTVHELRGPTLVLWKPFPMSRRRSRIDLNSEGVG